MSKLMELKVKNYRGFSSEQTIKFALPNGKKGSGLSLVVGPNNTGKTSIVESLTITTAKRINRGERHSKANPEITIISDTAKTIFTNRDEGSNLKTLEGDGLSQNHGLNFEIIASRRHWGSESSQEWNSDQFYTAANQINVRNNPAGANVAALLRSINQVPDTKTKFTNLVKELNKNFTFWTMDTDDNGTDYVKYVTRDGKEHRTNFLGDGLISVMEICAHLLDGRDNVLILDEPELSLHPSVQKKLAGLISKIATNRQVILCTHSPHFVDFEDYINGAEIIRLNKPNDTECVVSQLSRGYEAKVNNLMIDWHKPALLDYVAKELLFYERVLFVEGQEDAALVRKFYKDRDKKIDFEIFGYGVGGYGNMKLFLTLAKELQLEKVAALFDANIEIADLKTEFENNHVKFYQLNTEDIRDKVGCLSPECALKNKTGVFDNGGRIKRDAGAKHFYQTMSEIRSFLLHRL